MKVPKSKWTPFLWIAGGLFVVKQLAQQKDNPIFGPFLPADQINILDEISSGTAELLASITGTKKPAFVDKMMPIALQIQERYKIDPLITISQAAHESAWGLSGLTQKANNLFGFTGDSWADQGKSVIWMETDEWDKRTPDQITYFSKPGDIVKKTANPSGGTDLVVKRPFRSYPTWYDSVSDWANLMGAQKYSNALNDAKDGNLTAFANDVSAAGYATDPDYAMKLISVGDDVAALIQSA